MKLQVNTDYKIVFPSGDTVKATLYDVNTYPATGMSNDYLFRTLKGEVNPFSHSTGKMFKPNEFPLPEFVVNLSEVTQLTGFVEPDDNEVFENLIKQFYDIDPTQNTKYMEIHESLSKAVHTLDERGELSTDQKMKFDDATRNLVQKLQKMKDELQD